MLENNRLKAKTNLQMAPKIDISDNPNMWKEYFGNWIWQAVECLINTKDFDPSPRWIAQKLNISVGDAVDALDSLIKMKRIKRSSWGYDLIGQPACFSNQLDQKSSFLCNLYISTYICSKTTDYDNTKFRNRIMSGTNEQISGFISQINEAIRDFKISTERNLNHENVYAFSFNCVNLTPTKNKSQG